MAHLIELSGQRFGRLVVICQVPNHFAFRKILWSCQCDCGETRIVTSQNLRHGYTQSCGCLQRDLSRERAFKHGLIHAQAYSSWKGAKSRCYNPKVKEFKDYGGRGITMCDRWRGNFLAFFEDMGECPAGLSIERIDNNGNYEPGNCRWATPFEQNHNKRPQFNSVAPLAARMLELRATGKTQLEIAAILGVGQGSVCRTLKIAAKVETGGVI